MFGVPIGERVRRTTETVDVLRKAWAGERFSHQGKVFEYDRVRVTPPPARDGGPPIFLGGFVEAAVRRAGRLGDGFIRSRGGVDGAKQGLVWAREGAAEAGRDPDALSFTQLQNAFVAEDGDAWELARAGAAHQLGVYEAWRLGSDTPEHPSLDVPDPGDDAIRELTPAGDRHEVTRALRPWIDAFGDLSDFHLVVRLQYPGMDLETAGRAVELFGEAVLPALKGS